MAMRGKAPVDWGSKATAVQTVAWPESNDSWATAELPAEGPMPTCHPQARNLHADVSSAAVEIYAGSAGLSQGMWLSYVSDELGISFPTPVCIGVDNATAVAYANGTVKRSKIQHIDARQDWVGAMRDSNICKLWKVDTKENESDLLTKIHEADHSRGCVTAAWCSGRFRRSSLPTPTPSRCSCAAPAAEEATRNLRQPGSKSRARTFRSIASCGVRGSM